MARDQLATFGAGCFWGVEARFLEAEGVLDVTVGYMGGEYDHPTYRDVCTGRTGHAEVAQVRYDPDVVSFDGLLDLFFDMHNPTTLNRQGPDFGTQYRSAIFVHDAEQLRQAREKVEQLEKARRFPQPIVTEITEAGLFWEAEEYHQRYFEKNGGGYCHF